MNSTQNDWLQGVDDVQLMLRLTQTSVPTLPNKLEADGQQLQKASEEMRTAIDQAYGKAFVVIVFSNKERVAGPVDQLEGRFPGIGEMARIIGVEYHGHMLHDSSRVFVVDAPKSLGGYRFRVTAEQTLDQRILCIRKERPTLWPLKSLLKDYTDFFLKEILYANLNTGEKSPTPVNGGVILIIGEPNSGKTTLAASLIHEWMQRVPITAITLERNQDYRMPDFIDNGSLCLQLDISNRNPREVFERSVLTMSHDLLFFGEILQEEDAGIVIDAASSGKTVIATFHGKSIPSGLDRLVRKIKGKETEEVAREIVSDVLRWVIRVTPAHGSGGRSVQYQPVAFTQMVKTAWSTGDAAMEDAMRKAGALWRKQETQNTR